MLRITGIILACLFFMAPAEARQHHKHQHRHHVHHHHRIVRAVKASAASVFEIKGWWTQSAITYAPQREVASQRFRTVAAHEQTIVAHPAGCPTRLFCGCGASVRVFGHSVRELWLAANWYKFPRTYPAPGAVAVRRHHVMVLEADLGGGVWQVYDANSGGHATRIHARSLAGYTIVQPRA